jgi:ATP-dependent DNA helicase RecG
MSTCDDILEWIKHPESYNLEFKEAKNQFSKENVFKYSAALSNEGGGKLILGVSDSKEIIGTKAFPNYQTLSHEIYQNIHIRVNIEEILCDDERIIIFHIPKHPVGIPIKYKGVPKMRLGESITDMDDNTLRRILNETESDFSAQIVRGLTVNDLDKEALDNFRKLWSKKQRREEYLTYSDEKTLRSTGLLSDTGICYAGLILFGEKEKIDSLLPCSEIIFEWRHDKNAIPHDFRKMWREPFFKIFNEVWETINARNIRFPIQEGLFQRDIFAFNEKSVREALLNAVTHRDYAIVGQSIFIKASPEEFFIESPGGFPPGVTLENILNTKSWRNRCIAETFEKAGLVERAGQGLDDIFLNSIKEGKGEPDLTKSDNYSVRLSIPAQIKDKNFVSYLEKIVNETQTSLSFEEILELEKIRCGQKSDLPPKALERFLRNGIIERIGKTRDTKYILSRNYYVYTEKLGLHTRLRGLERNKYKTLIIGHLEKNEKGYIKEFKDAFFELEVKTIRNMLSELRNEGKIVFIGNKKYGFWILKNKTSQ